MSSLALRGTGGHLQLQVECNREIATGRGGDFPKRKMSGHDLEGNVGLKVDFKMGNCIYILEGKESAERNRFMIQETEEILIELVFLLQKSKEGREEGKKLFEHSCMLISLFW